MKFIALLLILCGIAGIITVIPSIQENGYYITPFVTIILAGGYMLFHSNSGALILKIGMIVWVIATSALILTIGIQNYLQSPRTFTSTDKLIATIFSVGLNVAFMFVGLLSVSHLGKHPPFLPRRSC